MNNSFSIKTKLVKSKEYLFDELRKKWIMSTPEEIVRQKFWKYLNIEKKYPMSLIAIEKQIKINGLNKRFDILIFDSHGNPNIIVECKSPKVKIDQSTLDQALTYQNKIEANFVILTNGEKTYCIKVDLILKKASYIKEIPVFQKNH
jgi:type I site-specific restriction endonuclease